MSVCKVTRIILICLVLFILHITAETCSGNKSWKTLALILPLFNQTGEILNSLNWTLMSPARRPLPFDPRHPQACPAVPPWKMRTRRGNCGKGVETQHIKAYERGDSLMFLSRAFKGQQHTSRLGCIYWMRCLSVDKYLSRWWHLKNSAILNDDIFT